MSRPIEPGCRAVIVNSWAGNDGKIVTVIRCCGEHLAFDDEKVHRFWVIDTSLPDTDGNYANYIQEEALRRIDDYDGDEVTSWDECVWRPEVVA